MLIILVLSFWFLYRVKIFFNGEELFTVVAMLMVFQGCMRFSTFYPAWHTYVLSGFCVIRI